MTVRNLAVSSGGNFHISKTTDAGRNWHAQILGSVGQSGPLEVDKTKRAVTVNGNQKDAILLYQLYYSGGTLKVFRITDLNDGSPYIVNDLTIGTPGGAVATVFPVLSIDKQGNLYSISERNPGYIFKFTPDKKGDLSSGQLYVLKITSPTGDRTGEAEWIPLDRNAVKIDASAAADAAGATGYNRPEDVELATSSGNTHGSPNTLFVAVTGLASPVDNRILAIDLREPAGGSLHSTAFVYDYVKFGLNTTSDFSMPDNLALDPAGNLYIAEDPGGSFASKRNGDDIWVARPGNGEPPEVVKAAFSLVPEYLRTPEEAVARIQDAATGKFVKNFLTYTANDGQAQLAQQTPAQSLKESLQKCA